MRPCWETAADGHPYSTTTSVPLDPLGKGIRGPLP